MILLLTSLRQFANPIKFFSALISGVLLVAGFSTCYSESSSSQAASHEVDGPNRFGIASGSRLYFMDEAEKMATLDSYKTLGARWLRASIDWGDIQKGGVNSYSWERADQLVNGALARGLRLVVAINGTPAWARLSTCRKDPACAPSDMQLYADFAKKVVERYSHLGVKHWELKNEPNHQKHWKPKPDPAAYTRLLQLSHTLIKQADPQAFVLTAGLGGEKVDRYNLSGPDFVAAMYEHGAKGYFDAVSYHPYTYPDSPSLGTRGWALMLRIRDLMVQNGDGDKQIWVTEYGAPTNGSRLHVVVTEDEQAALVTDAYTLFGSYSWAGPLFWFTYQDKGSDPDVQDDWFGLVRFDGSPKPSYGIYKSMVETAGP